MQLTRKLEMTKIIFVFKRKNFATTANSWIQTLWKLLGIFSPRFLHHSSSTDIIFCIVCTEKWYTGIHTHYLHNFFNYLFAWTCEKRLSSDTARKCLQGLHSGQGGVRRGHSGARHAEWRELQGLYTHHAALEGQPHSLDLRHAGRW